jgi:hypothetical protein
MGPDRRFMQRKTQRPVQFEITEQPRQSVEAWLAARGRRAADYLFLRRGILRRNARHGNARVRYIRGSRPSDWTTLRTVLTPCGARRLRRIYRRTKNLRTAHLLLGEKLESTVRYLGIEVDGRAN